MAALSAYGCVSVLSRGTQHHWVNLPRSIHFFIIPPTFPSGKMIKSHVCSHKTRRIRRNKVVPGGVSHKAAAPMRFRQKRVLAEDVIALTYHVKMRVRNPAHGEGSFSCMMLCLLHVHTSMGELTLPSLCPSTVNSSAKLCRNSSVVLGSPGLAMSGSRTMTLTHTSLLLSVGQWGC